MLRSPEQIKNALANCNKLRYCPYCEEHCPYKTLDLSCLRNLHADAREYIGRLEAERNQLQTDLMNADACNFCKHNGVVQEYCECDCSFCEHTDECPCFGCTSKNNHWGWRGMKEDEQQ